jgi:pyruvate formate lyase activating enzyme
MGEKFSPESIVNSASRLGCKSIAYTYSEPVIFMEYAYDTAKLAVDKGLKNVFVTNGYATEEALRKIFPYLHGANIDLKSMREEFYRENCGASLKPVLESIRLHKRLGIWIEVTTLVIPGMNDSDEELREIAEFIKGVGEGIPWHVSRFYPSYMMIDVPPTPLETIRKARDIGLESGLRYIYQGNVPGEGEHTICYNCGELLIERFGYHVRKVRVLDFRCDSCGVEVDGVWK